MRSLFILRGCPGSGKTTWVQNNHLENYTISADDMRKMLFSPQLTLEGKMEISLQKDREVWDKILKAMENKMERGEFICVDGTHYRSEQLNLYKKLIQKYRYRAYIVDFTDVPLSVILERNKNREKKVDEEAIRKINALFANDYEVSNRFNIISREEASKMLVEKPLFNFEDKKKLVIFGDIHGCYEPIKEWFEKNPFDEETYYIFTGDYIDRGIQNKEVLLFLSSIANKKNVLLLEGNHEKSLRLWAEDKGADVDIDAGTVKYLKNIAPELLWELRKGKIKSRMFLKDTIPQLDGVSKKEIRKLCSKFAQMAYITFGKKNILICHGGIPVPTNILIASEQIICGVGKYEDTKALYESWNKNNPDEILVHAHRNIYEHELKVSDNIYNLCDNVEYGENMRILEMTKDAGGNLVTKGYLIKNNVFNKTKKKPVNEEIDEKGITMNNILQKMSESPLVIKKGFGYITSYNFSRNAFYNSKWNQLTCTARGLFIENESQKIIARSYNKFFNYREVTETYPDYLQANLEYPMRCYRKENGFLALIAYDFVKDELLIASKSSIGGTYVDYIKEVFNNVVSKETQEKIKQYLKENNCTMVFECINHKDNNHPIWYKENHMYLLDIIFNDFEFKKLPYEDVVSVGKDFGLEVKELLAELNNWNEFLEFKEKAKKETNPTFEGYVFEDAKGFMFKYKLPFYKFWKRVRNMLEAVQHSRNVKKFFLEERDVRVYNILQKLLHEKGIEYMQNLTVVDIEKIYYNENGIEFNAVD